MNGKRLSVETRSEIAALYHTNTFSMQDLALRYKVSKSTVHDIVKKKRLYNTVADRPRSGRPKISTETDDRALHRLALTNRHLTAEQLRASWTVPASRQTVKNRLKKAGLRGYIARRKPLLTKVHRHRRLLWCKQRLNWTVEQWRQVIFSDESSFCLIPNTTRVYVRRRRHEAFLPDCLSPAYKTRSPTLMVWGAVSGNGVGPLVRCPTRMNQHSYKEILEPQVAFLQSGVFMQDNAPCHSTNLIRVFFEENDIETLPWPSMSPDLNPLENMWGKMKHLLQGHHLKNKDELWENIQRVWFSFSVANVQSYIDSMPSRIRACIKAKGGPTRY
jgi:transposase